MSPQSAKCAQCDSLGGRCPENGDCTTCIVAEYDYPMAVMYFISLIYPCVLALMNFLDI